MYYVKCKNWYYVAKNQKQILQLAKKNKHLFLEPRAPRGGGGNIEHYYHFIFDLILPLNCLLNKGLSDVKFLLHDFGIFTTLLKKIYPDVIEIIETPEQSKDLVHTKIIGMNPRYVFLFQNQLENLKYDIIKRLNISLNGITNKILLIERVAPSDYFIDKAKIKNSGSFRRSIINHDRLKSTIESITKKPFEFHNLQLENIPLESQITYFDRAAIVIAQHGAGLSNAIWMKENTIVIELTQHTTESNHFSSICKSKNIHYLRYSVNSRHIQLDLPHFLSCLAQQPILKDYFQLENKESK